MGNTLTSSSTICSLCNIKHIRNCTIYFDMLLYFGYGQNFGVQLIKCMAQGEKVKQIFKTGNIFCLDRLLGMTRRELDRLICLKLLLITLIREALISIAQYHFTVFKMYLLK